MKGNTQTDTYAPMFTVALFTIQISPGYPKLECLYETFCKQREHKAKKQLL